MRRASRGSMGYSVFAPMAPMSAVLRSCGSPLAADSRWRARPRASARPDRSSGEIGDHGIEHGKPILGDAKPAVIIDDDRALLAQQRDTAGVERPSGDRRVALGIDAFGEPQSHQQEFVGALFAIEFVIGD